MTINILRRPNCEDWSRCYNLATGTDGAPRINVPPMRWRERILDAEHSPIRTLVWTIEITDCPTWIAVHLARHWVGAEPYIQSQRNDRQEKYDRNAARQDEPVLVRLECNAQGLIDMSHRRLCNKAAKETRDLWQDVCAQIIRYNPEMDSVLVPMCIYRGGKCHEMKPCMRMEERVRK